MKERVLVLGGTGTLGRPVVRSLARSGHGVRLLARDPERAGRLFGPDIEVMAGDCTDSHGVQEALPGCQAVHISLPQTSELRAVEAVLRAAGPGQLTRISYISGTSIRPENRRYPMVEVKLRAEELLARSGVPHTIFCPTWIMEVLPRFIRGKRALIISGANPSPISFLAGADAGRMMARAFASSETLGKRLVLHGVEAVTLPVALELYLERCHPGIDPLRLPLWQARLLSRVKRRLRPVVDLLEYFHEVGELGDPGEADTLLGPPEITLQAWMESQGREPCYALPS